MSTDVAHNPTGHEKGAEVMAAIEKVFATPGFNGVIRTGSGRELIAVNSGDFVEIRDSSNPHYHFRAELTHIGDKDAVYFSIDSQDRNGQNAQHPDIYAARLMRRSVRHFEETVRGGVPIPRIAATWYTEPGASDNYTQLQANLAKYGPSQTERALRETWTGEQAKELGFTEIKGPYPLEDDFVEVYFDRPE